MRKTALYFFVTIFVWAFMGFNGLYAKTGGASYSPFSPVVINDPGRKMDSFYRNELPEILKRWKKLPQNASFKERFAKNIEVFQWSMNHYKKDQTSFVNDAITFVAKVPSRNWDFPITFSEYKYKNGKVIYYHNSLEEEISPVEFDKIKYAFAQKICESAEKSLKTIGNLRAKIIHHLKKRSVEYGVIKEDEDLEKKLAEIKIDVGNGEKMPADELMLIPPKFSFSDFAPKKVIITPVFMKNGSINGASYPDSGTVIYNPVALVYDYLKLGDTFTHELLHRNIYLQGMIISQQTDVETWASFFEEHDGAFEFLFHPYQESARSVAKVISSFDADRARFAMFNYNYLGALDVNGRLADDYGEKAEQIFEAFKGTMFEKFIVEFYADPIFWTCVNDDLYDDNGAFKVFMYSRYAFSLLGGSEKTEQWLKEHETVIKQAFEEARRLVDAEKERQKEKRKGKKIGDEDEVIVAFLLKHKDLLNFYSDFLNLSRFSSDERKAEQISLMIKLGVINIPQFKMDPEEVIYVKKSSY